MKVSFNKDQSTYTLHDISEFQMMLISTALHNENTRLMVMSQLSDEDFKQVILNDAEFLNAAAQQSAVDVETLKEALNDPKELKELRSKSQFGKNSQSMQRLVGELVEGQRKITSNISLDIPV